MSISNLSPEPTTNTSEEQNGPSTSIDELDKFQPTSEAMWNIVYISVFYLFVTLFIGIPLWWKTTAPYHAGLPYAQIDELNSRAIEINVPISLINFVDKLVDEDLERMKSVLTNYKGPEDEYYTHTNVIINYHITVHQASTIELQAYHQSMLASNSLEYFTSNFEKHADINEDISVNGPINSSLYSFFIMPCQNHSWFEQFQVSNPLTSMDQVYSVIRHLPSLNVVYIFMRTSKIMGDVSYYLGKHIKHILDSILINADHLRDLGSMLEPNTDLVKGDRLSKLVSQRLPASDNYGVTVTFLIHHGTKSTGFPIRSGWTDQFVQNPLPWLQSHVEPAFLSWSPYVRVNIYSQRLHAVDIEQLKPSRISQNSSYRYYTQDDLSYLINHLESYLGAPQAATSDSSNIKPGLHILLLLSEPIQDSPGSEVFCPLPLRFHLPSTSSKLDVTDVALIPQWGGLISIDSSGPCLQPSKSSVKLIGRKMISIIRSILGAPPMPAWKFNKFTNLDDQIYIIHSHSDSLDKISNWEMNAWFLHRIVESITETKRTINSLINLLARLPNMVIQDSVAEEVFWSCSNWTVTLNSLNEFGKICPNNQSLCSLGGIFTSAHKALTSSNGAFFNPSLLGLLYFEEDQKYGIYTPLFAPFAFALAMSTYRAFRIMFPRK